MIPMVHDLSNWPPPWLDGVIRRIARRWPGLAKSAWVVAVSGGSDSVGLLRVLDAIAPNLDLKLSVAHLDHGVRGEAARADAAFVEALADRLGLPLDLGRWEPSRPRHFEADARRARYAWLLEVAHSRGARAVAVGHTADDQAETILHRIVRGTGLRGLAGIPPERMLSVTPPVTLVRPLLQVSRQEIRRSLGAIEQEYREDASNLDRSRTRARIRHDLLPCLATEYNPRVAEAIVRLGTLAAASERALERQVREVEDQVTRSLGPDRIELDRKGLARLPRFLRVEVLRRAWRKAGWPEKGMSARRWHRLAGLAMGHDLAARPVGPGIVLSTLVAGQHSGGVVMGRVRGGDCGSEGPEHAVEIALEIPGCVTWRGATIRAVLDPDAPRDETVDLDQIIEPLRVRAPAAGDRFQPLGMNGKSMALNDFFRGRGVRREERPLAPLLCDTSGIVWVVGHRIADRARVTERTTSTLGLRWEPGP